MEKETNEKIISKQNTATSIEFLNTLVEDPTLLGLLTKNDRKNILIAAGKLSRPDKIEIAKRGKAIKKKKRKLQLNADREARANTGIRTARNYDVFSAPLQLTHKSIQGQNSPLLKSSRECYVCRTKFTTLHHFYDSMCSGCADFNYDKRFQTADLSGQVALITGSRLKIGYQCTLMMLRAGATVIATTRFPKDSAIRFAKESDYKQWCHRLQIYGLDLRHTPSVEIFAKFIERQYDRLDILINNAAQTVRRPPGFYAHMMPIENSSNSQLPQNAQTLLRNHFKNINDLAQISQLEENSSLPVSWSSQTTGIGIISSAQLSQVPYSYDSSDQVTKIFPKNKLDADLQQVDLRETNSWRLKIGEIETPEMLEVQLVNSIAPFVLCNRLTGLMKKDFTGKKHIVNVSAMEGKFHLFQKEDRHPHTNMAKAALNMLTNTSAGGLAKHGIYMNAVDTGWVTDEDPAHLAESKQQIHDFQPPLDIVDGAARVYDPFFDGINRGEHWCGKFLKDYYPISW